MIKREPEAASSSTELDSENQRLAILNRINESLTATLDLGEVVQRVVETTRVELSADRVWLIHPFHARSGSVSMISAPESRHDETISSRGETISIHPSPFLIEALAGDKGPLILADEQELLLPAREPVGSRLVTALRSRMGETWGFGADLFATRRRRWSESERALFGDIARIALVSLTNAQSHRSALAEAAKVNAILDQIPEAVAIYNINGQIERLNDAALRALIPFDSSAETNYRQPDGTRLPEGQLPPARALRGETIRGDYLIDDPKSGEMRSVQLKAAPIRDDRGVVIGSLVLTRDTTDERQKMDRELVRRRYTECLATLDLDLAAVQLRLDDLNDHAQQLARALGGTAEIFLYRTTLDHLELVGASSVDESVTPFFDHVRQNPLKPGEGLAGTVFQIGRLLLFSEIRGNAVLDFARDEHERKLLAAMSQGTLVACPIESFGERVGALVLSFSDSQRTIGGEEVSFAQAVAEKIGSAAYVQRLTRVSHEGHRAAEELARREVDARARLEAVIETAPIGVAVVSADELRFEMVNERFFEFASRMARGDLPEDLVGNSVIDVIPALGRKLERVADLGEPSNEQALEVRRGTSLWHFNVFISPVRGRFSGTIQTLTILVQDVTESFKAKKEIEALAQLMEERSARLDSILGSMTDGLWVCDSAGNVVDVNQAALDMFGIASRSEAIRRGSFTDFNLRYPDGRVIPQDDLPLARALRGEVVPDYLAIGKHLLTGVDMDLSIAVAPIDSGRVVGAVIVIRDITALQELDRKKDEFLSVASHELRTPLTTIKGYSQLLESSGDDISQADRMLYLRAVLSEIERMMGLISELLDVSRIETNRLQITRRRIEWLPFVESLVSSFQLQHPNRDVTFESDLDAVEIEVDPDRMRQVLDNLVSNAIKYSSEGTPIAVRVRRKDGWIDTSVHDRGIGIPKDEVPHLFERFHRARNVSSRYYGGLGLGLYIAKALVEAHDGEIDIESEEGKGSTFTVSLPEGAPAAH